MSTLFTHQTNNLTNATYLPTYLQTRVTTTYHISKPKPRRSSKSQKPSAEEPLPPSSTTTAPRGSLTLKTYDPHSGACLKYRTTKAAEVGRLILCLGAPLAGRMAALPLPEAGDEVMADAPGEDREKETPVVAAAAAAAAATTTTGGGAGAGKKEAQGQTQQGGGGGGGKGKKKRGKK